MDIGSYTDIGKVRQVNEDDYYVSDYVTDLEAIYAMVADGMGGHLGGEVASSTAIHVACDYIEANFDRSKGQKGITTYTIRKENIVSQAALTKMKNGEGNIDTRTLERLCSILNCQPGDIMEYVSEKKIKEVAKQFGDMQQFLIQNLKEQGITEEEYKSMLEQVLPMYMESLFNGGNPLEEIINNAMNIPNDTEDEE